MDQNKANAVLRELGAQVRAARNRAGLDQRSLARFAGFKAHSRISDIENGKYQATDDEYERLLDALDITEHDERERILDLAAQAVAIRTPVTVDPAVILGNTVQLIDHERVARRIVAAAPLLLPGLLQTSEYARAIHDGRSDIAAQVALRAGRRDILVRPDPVQLVALIDSTVFLRPVIPPAEMVSQLRHILWLGERPNVTIQVVPSRACGYHAMLAGQFELIEFSAASPIVLLDHHYAPMVLRDPEEVAKYVNAAEHLRTEVAMTAKDSETLIAEIAQGMERHE
ncbi:hypothetical protein ALI144C_35250 [Actinosynnema sp. ALI-1.44]|uniref:helix-turn-helix domain-containing protein n=1 Tax=Actinosynnema sp. ALI-1.44 TaxID=1933779 RepID=UPI00097C43FA|nr:helix-turn-helix transcriptional regulator [Actinosynnema sp. ALI-1.44]ONI77313.1 hypothetical protein ALI144C_35250 [Actinosynnema sp. ALI-1.44]